MINGFTQLSVPWFSHAELMFENFITRDPAFKDTAMAAPRFLQETGEIRARFSLSQTLR